MVVKLQPPLDPHRTVLTCCIAGLLLGIEATLTGVAIFPLSLTTAAFSRDWTRTIFLRGDDENYTMTTRGRMMERLQVILAGRAAEEVAYQVPSTYSISDLRVRKLLLPHAV